MKKSLFFLTIFICFSCNNTAAKKEGTGVADPAHATDGIRQLDWLLGSWENTSENVYSRETWKFENQNAYSGHSFTTVASDTVFEEYMLLRQQGSEVILTVTAVNQNDEKPVDFKMIPSAPGHFTFENKQHDFPKQITYSNPSKDSLYAWIEGVDEGVDKKIDFHFTRN